MFFLFGNIGLLGDSFSLATGSVIAASVFLPSLCTHTYIHRALLFILLAMPPTLTRLLLLGSQIVFVLHMCEVWFEYFALSFAAIGAHETRLQLKETVLECNEEAFDFVSLQARRVLGSER